MSTVVAAARRLLDAQGGMWDGGTVYISVAMAKKLNAAMAELRVALTHEESDDDV